MITEYVSKTEELIDLSKGTIRFTIEQEPVYLSDMAGRNKYQSPEVHLILKYTAMSKDTDPRRIISLKVDLGYMNRFGDKTERQEKYDEIKEAAIAEIEQFLDKNNPRVSRDSTLRSVGEGGFE